MVLGCHIIVPVLPVLPEAAGFWSELKVFVDCDMLVQERVVIINGLLHWNCSTQEKQEVDEGPGVSHRQTTDPVINNVRWNAEADWLVTTARQTAEINHRE